MDLVVACGPEGLGVGLDEFNRVTRLVPGGQAERDGLLQVDDKILAAIGK